VKNIPDGQSALAFTRDQLDRLGIGQDLQEIPWGPNHNRDFLPWIMLVLISERVEDPNPDEPIALDTVSE
jgi:hypothetical protein